jgi:hypothetical protein
LNTTPTIRVLIVAFSAGALSQHRKQLRAIKTLNYIVPAKKERHPNCEDFIGIYQISLHFCLSANIEFEVVSFSVAVCYYYMVLTCDLGKCRFPMISLLENATSYRRYAECVAEWQANEFHGGER